MRQRLRGMMSRLSLFWRYFFLMAAMILVFLAAFTVATEQFADTLQDAYLEQVQGSFEQNAQQFLRGVTLTRVLSGAMEEHQDYLMVSVGMRQEEVTFTVAVREMYLSFSHQCLLLDLPEHSFVYFRKSGICLTRQGSFPDLESCLDTYLIYEGEDNPVTRELEKTGMSLGYHLLPSETVSVQGRRGRFLTLLVSSDRKEAVYGFLYSEEEILNRFQIGTLPEDTYFNIIHEDGTVLLSHEAEKNPDKGYVQLTCPLPALSSVAYMGIPEAYFQNTVRSSQVAAQAIFLLSVIIGVALCVFFSHLSVRPFRRLIQNHAVGQSKVTSANELLALDQFLKTTREKNVALRGVLLSSLLVRAFSGLTIPEEEYKKIAAAFPIFRQPLRVAVVRDRSAEHALEESSAMITLLRAALPEQFMCEYINIQESVLLFPDTQELCQQLQDVLMELNAHPERGGRFACGISMPFLGASGLGPSIRQAQYCVPESAEHVVAYALSPDENGESDGDDVDLKQFQQALACWNQPEALAQIDRMAAFVGKNSRVKPQEMFYSMLFVLRETAETGKLSFEDHEKMTYEATSSPVANLRRLKGPVNNLFEQKAAQQLSDKQMLCGEIVQYIREHYSDATLCMAAMAKQFCVSERFVYNAVVDITGMNVSNFIAQCRMQEAARLLRDTDENISTIAEKCGYPVESTFYRNFKKYYHMTPADYKRGR